jgi:hypothetical protein
MRSRRGQQQGERRQANSPIQSDLVRHKKWPLTCMFACNPIQSDMVGSYMTRMRSGIRFPLRPPAKALVESLKSCAGAGPGRGRKAREGPPPVARVAKVPKTGKTAEKHWLTGERASRLRRAAGACHWWWSPSSWWVSGLAGCAGEPSELPRACGSGRGSGEPGRVPRAGTVQAVAGEATTRGVGSVPRSSAPGRRGDACTRMLERRDRS